MADDRLMTVPEVAAYCRVNVETVRRWLRDGKLRGVRFGARAGYRVTAAELERFLKAAA
ncbi:MAG TPA: helix-turn-helix domain-containing protein [Chloroflexota bacterium]|nr:helix-turn-helix domain-containing protein [Chloroflexota bacterium]